jgi:hypothetical protein
MYIQYLVMITFNFYEIEKSAIVMKGAEKRKTNKNIIIYK